MSRSFRSASRRADRRAEARRWLLVVFAISVLVVVVKTCTLITGRTNPVDQAINRAATPFVVVMRLTAQGIGSLGHVFRLPSLLRKVKELDEENTLLKRRTAEADAIRVENEQLKQALGLTRRDFRSVRAVIVARPYDLWLDEVMLDVGSRHGVKRGDLVTNASGVVGVVSDHIESDYCWVTLVTSPRFRLAVVTGISRTHGMIRGSANRLKVENVRSRADAVEKNTSSTPGDLDMFYVKAGSQVELGEKIFTDGVADSSSSADTTAIVERPSGILVGYVRHRDTDPNGYLNIVAEPAVNPNKISIVSVMIR
jgi:cell shape-determining protein MreC